MELEKYVITIEYLGRFERESENIFFALDTLKKELSPDIRFNILSAYVIKGDNFMIDITTFLTGKESVPLVEEE